MKSQKQFVLFVASFILIIHSARSQNNFAELLQLDAIKEEGSIRVNWITNSESNSLYFCIERSVNYIDYDSIGVVPAAGISNSHISYTFLDENPPGTSCVFYRLKIRYNDSTFDLSNPCEACTYIFIQKTNVFYPQPVSDVSYLVIEGVDRNEPAQVIITDLTGRIVIDETLENPYHLTTLFFSCERKYFYEKGLYFLRVFNSKKEIYQTEILVI